MCVIVYKPADVTISKKDLVAMWNQNPDGAGLAYSTTDLNGQSCFQVEKGFMTYRELQVRTKQLRNKQLFIHFRRKTHGALNALMTHPFSLSSIDSVKHQQTSFITSSLLFHNGIISEFGNNELSDTAEFAIKVIAKLDHEERIKILNKTSGKFIYLHDNKYHIIGHFKTYKGLTVSNTYFAPAPKMQYPYKKQMGFHHSNVSSYGYNDYFDDDYYDNNYNRLVKTNEEKEPVTRKSPPNLLPSNLTPYVVNENEKENKTKEEEQKDWDEFMSQLRYF